MTLSDMTRRGFVKLAGATGVIGAGLSLAACGGTNETEPGSTATTSSGASNQIEGPDGSFKVGNIGPLTGAAAIYGTATNWGAQVAVNEVNATAGDVTFSYNCQDDTHNAETSVNAYNNLKDWGLQVLIGTTTTAPCVAVSAETNNDNIFELTPSASSVDVIGEGSARKSNVFQMCFTDPNQGKVSADMVKEKALGSKIAIIYDQSDTYSTGLRDGFVAEAAEIGLDIVSEEAFTADNNTDFSAQLNAAQSKGADVVMMPFYYQQGGLVLQQAKDMGFAPAFVGMDGMDGILAQEGFDVSLAVGLYLITPFTADATDEANTAFVKAYTALSDGGVVPNQFAADAYDCVMVVKQAIETAGVTADMDASAICDELVKTITSEDFKYSGLTGKDMTWSEDGTVSKVPVCYVIKEGEYVAV
jgi:branched-chain amino acid transport system substrate-binding protein